MIPNPPEVDGYSFEVSDADLLEEYQRLGGKPVDEDTATLLSEIELPGLNV